MTIAQHLPETSHRTACFETIFLPAIAAGQVHSYFRAPLTTSRTVPASLPNLPAIMSSIISVANLSKTYGSGFKALKNVNLDIKPGEIFALLGPNGAGKTTLISIICGIANPSEGRVLVGGEDIRTSYRKARSLIGLVPQELHTDAFESVWATVSFSRGLFGKPKNPAHIEKVLKDLSLWDKKDNKIITLSGGMKRRVMIAKALSHEPQILFLDEPTAGVDVELRKGMWEVVRTLQQSGVTIILTTHYIEEAEEMADRIGIINKGEIVLVEDKATLMEKLGKKRLTLHLQNRITSLPDSLAHYELDLSENGATLVYDYDTKAIAPASPACSATCATPASAQRSRHDAIVARGHLRRPREDVMNYRAVRAIYLFEMARTWRTVLQSIVSPVVSTSLYFVVFGAAPRSARASARSRASATAPSSCRA